MGFSRREYWSGLSCPPPGNPNPGVEPRSPALQVDSLPSDPPGKPSERGRQAAGSPLQLWLEPRARALCARHGSSSRAPCPPPPWGSGCEEPACNAGDPGSIPGSGRIPGGGMATPVFLPGESQGQRSLVGCRSQGHKELDTTERLTFSLGVSCPHSASRDEGKVSSNLYRLQIIILGFSQSAGEKLFYTFINSKGLYQFQSLFGKQIIFDLQPFLL